MHESSFSSSCPCPLWILDTFFASKTSWNISLNSLWSMLGWWFFGVVDLFFDIIILHEQDHKFTFIIVVHNNLLIPLLIDNFSLFISSWTLVWFKIIWTILFSNFSHPPQLINCRLENLESVQFSNLIVLQSAAPQNFDLSDEQKLSETILSQLNIIVRLLLL